MPDLYSNYSKKQLHEEAHRLLDRANVLLRGAFLNAHEHHARDPHWHGLGSVIIKEACQSGNGPGC